MDPFRTHFLVYHFTVRFVARLVLYVLYLLSRYTNGLKKNKEKKKESGVAHHSKNSCNVIFFRKNILEKH